MANKTRNALRDAIFSSDRTKPQVRTVTFFGEELEIRQPDLRTILSISSSSTENRQMAIVDMIIAYAYVPETDERVFEDADRDQLLALPFGNDYSELQKAISDLTNVNVLTDTATKNSDGTALGSA